MRHGTKHVRVLRKHRTSENSVNAKFAEAPYGEDKRCMLVPSNQQRVFRGGVRTQQCNRPFLRPTPTASGFATYSVPALQQVEHGSLHPSVLLLSTSPTNQLMRLG